MGGQKTGIRSLAFYPDRRILAAGCVDGTVIALNGIGNEVYRVKTSSGIKELVFLNSLLLITNEDGELLKY